MWLNFTLNSINLGNEFSFSILMNVTFYDDFVFLDIDECLLKIDKCSQLCTNTKASYECSCKTGYQLQADKRTCTGTEHLSDLFSILSSSSFLYYQ